MSYNPADDIEMLKRIAKTGDDEENTDNSFTDTPPRWRRCMAARILHQNALLKSIQQILEDYDYVKPSNPHEEFLTTIIEHVKEIIEDNG